MSSRMPTATQATGSQIDGILAKRKKSARAEWTARTDSDQAQALDKQKAKSKDPAFRATTLYLRKTTWNECVYRLRSTEDAGGRRDMSQLVQDLLATWLAGPIAKRSATTK